MGFIEETGAAQHFRDARITAIYEGTTAIQANDLIGRKIARENGETPVPHVKRCARSRPKWPAAGTSSQPSRRARPRTAVEEAVALHRRHLPMTSRRPGGPGAFLKLLGIVAGGWRWRVPLVAGRKLEAGR